MTKEEVRHVAKLAKLELTEEEVKKFQGQLSSVLEYFEILDEVNTKNIEPTSQVTGLENVFRLDKDYPCQTQEEALSGTSSKNSGMFKVGKIF